MNNPKPKFNKSDKVFYVILSMIILLAILYFSTNGFTKLK